MGITTTALASAAANIAYSATAAKSAAPSVFAPATLPDWLQLLLALVGIGIGAALIRVLIEFSNRFPKRAANRTKEFTRMLCDQVWTHSDAVTNVFGQRLRQPPTDIVSLRILVRNLREDLAAPANFVEQMRIHPPGAWPSYALFNAFNDWGGQLRAMASQLADLQQAVTYPVVREPVDTSRDALLVHHFQIEQAFLDRGIDKLRDYAFEICDAAKKLLAAAKRQDEAEGEHHECPCCKRAAERHSRPARDPLQPIVVVPPPPPPLPAPAAVPPATATCCCAVPRPCQCARCACVCACPVPAKSA